MVLTTSRPCPAAYALYRVPAGVSLTAPAARLYDSPRDGDLGADPSAGDGLLRILFTSDCMSTSFQYTPVALQQLLVRAHLDDLPFSKTTSRSALRSVERRWAMAKVVRPLTRRAMASWICFSVSVSTELVASSRIRMRGSCRMARAIEIRWRSPPESGWPRSPTWVS